MKYMAHLSKKVQVQIIQEYLEKAPDGKIYKYTLKQIADKHEISVGTVNGLVREAKKNPKFKGRGPGRRRQAFLNARIMKILRDAGVEGRTMEEVGELNPRIVTSKNGVKERVPLSRQRVAKILKKWQHVMKKSRLRGKRFRPGDLIQWDQQRFRVVRYDTALKGAAIDERDGTLIDPFIWVYQGARARMVQPAQTEMTPEQVINAYLKSDSKRNVAAANGASAQ